MDLGKSHLNSKPEFPNVGTVIDACGGDEGISEFFRSMLRQKLLWTDKKYCPIGNPQRLLPSPLLSDAEGLRLWREVTRLPSYYQTDDEIELFKKHGREVALSVPPGAILIDLGCGDVRKAKPLLDYLEQLKNSVWYFAVDLSREALEYQMGILAPQYQYVKCCGLWGTFDNGLTWLNAQSFENPRFFMSLGSIFGNDHFDDAVKYLSSWRTKGFRRQTDALLLTMDGTEDLKTIWESYHDHIGLFEKFIRNGYKHSNRVLKQDWYHDGDWEFSGLTQEQPRMHRFMIRAKVDVTCPALNLALTAGTEIDCYEAFKYPPDLMRAQFAKAGFHEVAYWKAPRVDIYQYLIVSGHKQTSFSN